MEMFLSLSCSSFGILWQIKESFGNNKKNMENFLKTPSYSVQQVFELARQYKDLLPWKERHNTIINFLAEKGIVVDAQDVRHAISGSNKNLDILLAIIELGKKEEEKIGKVVA